MSKGSKQRPTDMEKFGRNWANIFRGKTKEDKAFVNWLNGPNKQEKDNGHDKSAEKL